MKARDRMFNIAKDSNCGTDLVMSIFDNAMLGMREHLDGECLAEQPQLIQGYTAEQWQEIIDGGYLCEARDTDSRGWVPVILLRIDNDDSEFPFKIKYSAPNTVLDDEDHDWQRYCRPAQIKGVMRPIFVEPVDGDAYCVFFDVDGKALHTGMMRWSFRMQNPGYSGDACKATKYIEL